MANLASFGVVALRYDGAPPVAMSAEGRSSWRRHGWRGDHPLGRMAAWISLILLVSVVIMTIVFRLGSRVPVYKTKTFARLARNEGIGDGSAFVERALKEGQLIEVKP